MDEALQENLGTGSYDKFLCTYEYERRYKTKMIAGTRNDDVCLFSSPKLIQNDAEISHTNAENVDVGFQLLLENFAEDRLTACTNDLLVI